MPSKSLVDPFEDSSDDERPLNESSQNLRAMSLVGYQKRFHVLIEVLYIGFSSVVLGAFGSLMGPIVPSLMSKMNLHSYSTAFELLPVNATGCHLGVILAMYFFTKFNATALMPIAMALCASVAVILPHSSTWFAFLFLIFTKGVLMGVIDRGRFILDSSRLDTGCRTMLVIYLCFSSGAVVPLLSYSAFLSSTMPDEQSLAETKVVRKRFADYNSTFNDTGSLVDAFQVNATVPLPVKPKFVDGAGLITEQSYSQRKEKQLKQLKINDASTKKIQSTTTEASGLNASRETNAVVSSSTTAKFTAVDNSGSGTSMATLEAMVPKSFKEKMNMSTPSNAVLVGQDVDSSVTAFMTSAAMGYAVSVLMMVSCLLLACQRRQGWASPPWLKDHFVNDASESTYAKTTVLLSVAFVFLISATEALLQSLMVVYLIQQYSSSLASAVRVCCLSWIFLSVGRLLALVAKNASGRLVGCCLSMALLIAAGTVFSISRATCSFLLATVSLFLGPVSPLAFSWLYQESGCPAGFITLWLMFTNFGRLVVPYGCARLMEHHQAKDYCFVLVATALAGVVLLIPIDKAAKQSRTFCSASVRRKVSDRYVVYSKLVRDGDVVKEEIVHSERASR